MTGTNLSGTNLTDTDLIVPMRVHALAVNRHLYNTNGFYRWQPDFYNMTMNKQSAEPYRPSSLPWWEWPLLREPGGNPPFDLFGGVHVQWELPEALTTGYVDPETDANVFPLVPNRWLVVRYSGPADERRARGWVVQSDYLESEPITGPDGGVIWGMDRYITPGVEPPREDWIGRIHDLRTDPEQEPWREPEAPRPPFLTAIGPGTPGFAFFDAYHCGVFSMRDDLSDLHPVGGVGDYPRGPLQLSYQVLGWYSDDRSDLLAQASRGELPELLPPDAQTLADILDALGWQPPAGPDGEPVLPDSLVRTVYCGRALGTFWDLNERIPDPDKPDIGRMSVTIGLSTDEVIGTLVRHQTGDVRTGELMQALVQGTVEKLDDAAGGYSMNQETHTSQFGGPDPGLTWAIQPRPDVEEPPDPTAEDLRWLAQLNRDQAAFEDTLAALAYQRQRCWTLVYLLELPNGFNSDEDAAAGLLVELTHLLRRAGMVAWLGELPPDLAPPAGAAVVNDLISTGNSRWLASLSADQRLQLMERAREVVYRGLPAYFCVKPAGWDPGEARAEIRELEASIDDLTRQAAALREQIPHVAPGEDEHDDEALDAAADRFADEHGLSPELQLRRAPGTSFYVPGDPVAMIEGAGNFQPLTRDADDPLPLRVASRLLTEVTIDGTPTPTPTTAPSPDLDGLPLYVQADAEALLCEFSVLDKAAITATSDGIGYALQIVVVDPPANSEGPWPEYTQQWRQAWRPAYISWHLDYVRLPYTDQDGPHWELSPITLTQVWDGENAEPGTGSDEGRLRWHPFATRSYLTPAADYIMRSQLTRYLETFPVLPREGLIALRRDLQASDTLLQTLDGFNDFLLQLNPGLNEQPDADIMRFTGLQDTVPTPGANNFQAIRAGQFFFRELDIVDRFGRVLSIVNQDNANSFVPVRAPSVVPDHLASDSIRSPERFLQLGPRILQPTRLQFDPERPSTLGRTDKAPAAGWLIYNLIDRSLLVYAADGTGLGAVRVTTNEDGALHASWLPLPFSPFPELGTPGFAAAHPELHGMFSALVSRPDSASAFQALMTSIDNSLNAGYDELATDDQTLASLTGRPIAVIRARLRLELQGPPVANPSWDTATNPDGLDYLQTYFPIRLGDPIEPTEGLVGYFTAPPGTEPVAGADEHDTDYHTLLARLPADASVSDYVRPITNGDDLALPPRYVADEEHPPLARYVTLLADPHSAVYAITDILPIRFLQLNADAVHVSLSDLRTVATVAPLLGVTRNQRCASTTIGEGYGTSTPNAGPVDTILDGRPWTWYESSRPPLPGEGVTIDLGEVHDVVMFRAHFGEPDGKQSAPAKKLQASRDGEDWADLGASASASATELTWPQAGSAQPPIAARYLRLEMTEAAAESTVIRAVEITCDPDDNHMVMPQPAPWHGTFDWNEARPPGGGEPWHAYPLTEADTLSHPDDPPQIARAGYLRQRPPAPAEPEEDFRR